MFLSNCKTKHCVKIIEIYSKAAINSHNNDVAFPRLDVDHCIKYNRSGSRPSIVVLSHWLTNNYNHSVKQLVRSLTLGILLVDLVTQHRKAGRIPCYIEWQCHGKFAMPLE